MKTFRDIIFTFAVLVVLTFSVSAQKGDPKGRPPKEKPPTVDPGNKNTPPPRNPPKEKPGKPGMAFIATPSRDEELG